MNEGVTVKERDLPRYRLVTRTGDSHRERRETRGSNHRWKAHNRRLISFKPDSFSEIKGLLPTSIRDGEKGRLWKAQMSLPHSYEEVNIPLLGKYYTFSTFVMARFSSIVTRR